ncbi:MAG TPA: SDR family NAD(P)-dependent oxidoreductase, partial [Myxococcota bacterium]|nr:SDR family NAD(P)-dependent oxidoreductase [Myxococcota bacterium]
MLENKVAIVSGIGPGMGRDISLRLAGAGADLVLVARSAGKLEEVAAEVEQLGRRAARVQADISVPADAQRIADAALAAYGRIDVLVNNAFHPGTMTPFEQEDLERWREILDVNLLGTLRLTQAVVPSMKARRSGSIVMISTMSTRVVNPGFAGYAASKAGLNAAMQGLARELGPSGIRVNAVLPGYIWGPGVKGYFERQAAQRGVTPEDCYREVAGQIPLRRIPDS